MSKNNALIVGGKVVGSLMKSTCQGALEEAWQWPHQAEAELRFAPGEYKLPAVLRHCQKYHVAPCLGVGEE